MKNIKNLLLLALLSITIFSCDREKIDSGITDSRENTIFFSSSSANLFVEDGKENIINIPIGSTSLVDSSLEYTINIDPTSTAVEGVDFTIINNATSFTAGQIINNLRIQADFENSLIEGKTVKLILSSTDALVSSKSSFTLNLFKFCPFAGLNTNSYTASVFAFGEEAPSHQVTLVPVTGSNNQWSITSSWGPEFVAWATGDTGFSGRFIYSGTLIVNNDFTLTFVGNDSWATGGSGSFSPCTQEFSMTLTQGLFTNAFTVDVVLTPN